MSDIFWPKDELDAARADAAQQSLSEKLAAFWRQYAQQQQPPSQPVQQPALPSLTLDRNAFMPWLEDTAKTATNTVTQGVQQATSALPSLDDVSAWMPWREKPQPRPSRADTTPPATGVAPTRPAAFGGTPQPMPQVSAQGQGEPLGTIAEGDPEQFFATAGPYARRVERDTGIPAALILAVAANETGYGQKRYMAGANNYFGIQAQPGEAGAVPYKDWRPGPGGGQVFYDAAQRSFADPLAGFYGFASFLKDNPRYAQALQQYQQTGNVEQLARDVHAAGYAEDPQWSNKLISIMRGIPTATGVGEVTDTRGVGLARPQPASGTPQAMPSASGDDLTPDQAALDDPDKWSLCGPVAAVAMARARGGNWTVAQAKAYAQQNGLWNAKQGMGGLQAEAKLLNGMGVAASARGVDWNAITQDVRGGNPVTLSTTFIDGGHYVVLEAYDPATGKFKVGGLGNVLKKTTGRGQWYTIGELNDLGGIQGALHFDNPASPTPSVAATAPTAGVPSAPADSPPTAPATPSPTQAGVAGVAPDINGAPGGTHAMLASGAAGEDQPPPPPQVYTRDQLQPDPAMAGVNGRTLIQGVAPDLAQGTGQQRAMAFPEQTPPTSSYNDPTDGGTQTQPLPVPVQPSYNDPTAGGTQSQPLPVPQPQLASGAAGEDTPSVPIPQATVADPTIQNPAYTQSSGTYYDPNDPTTWVNPDELGTLRPTDLPPALQGARPWNPPVAPPQGPIRVAPHVLDQIVPRAQQTAARPVESQPSELNPNSGTPQTAPYAPPTPEQQQIVATHIPQPGPPRIAPRTPNAHGDVEDSQPYPSDQQILQQQGPAAQAIDTLDRTLRSPEVQQAAATLAQLPTAPGNPITPIASLVRDYGRGSAQPLVAPSEDDRRAFMTGHQGTPSGLLDWHERMTVGAADALARGLGQDPARVVVGVRIGGVPVQMTVSDLLQNVTDPAFGAGFSVGDMVLDAVGQKALHLAAPYIKGAARGVVNALMQAAPPLQQGASAVGRGARALGEEAAGRLLEMTPSPSVVQRGTGGVARTADEAPPEAAPVFYSQLRRVIEEKMPSRAGPDQVQGIIKSGGVKPDEVTWTGLDDWLSSQKGPVTKQQVLDFLDQNQVRVEEVVKGGPVGKQEALAALDRRNNVWPENRPNGDPMDRDQVLNAPDGTRFIVGGNGTKYGQYTLPGGKNYRELLMTLPESANTRASDAAAQALENEVRALGLPENTTPQRILEAGGSQDLADRWQRYKLHGDVGVPYESYQSSHWQEPNVLAHVRFNDRTGPNGEKILLVEEVQSDWHQAGRKQGYQGQLPPGAVLKQFDPASEGRNAGRWVVTNEAGTASFGIGDTPEEAIAAMNRGEGLTPRPDGVPNAPFQKTWPELAMKRMIRWAAEHGYDKIAWPPGQVHAERYNLANQVSRLEYIPGDNMLQAFDRRGERVFSQTVPPAKVEDYVGREVAQNLLSRPVTQDYVGRDIHALEGEGLAVGGQGMKGFYDQILPAVAQKLGKKFGARVGQTEIPKGGERKYVVLDQDRNVVATFDSQRAADAEAHRLRARDAQWGDYDYYAVPQERGMDAQTVHSLDITPAMRESVVGQGQPLFSAFGVVPDGTTGGSGRLGAVNRALGQGIQSVVAGGVGAQVNQQMNPDDPYAGVKGFAGGALLPPAVKYGARGLARAAGAVEEGRLPGALATFGASPGYKPPTPAALKAAEAQGARRGAMLNQSVTAPPSAVPARVRAATAATDDRAALRWAEDMLSDAAGNPRMRENDPRRPSTQSRVNSGSIANERITNELEQPITSAAQAGLQHELPQHLQDMHARDILDDFYRRGHQEAWDRQQQAIDKAQAAGASPQVIQRMQQRQQVVADQAGTAAMRKRQGGNPDMTYEAIDARLQAQEQRLTADGRWQQLQDAAKGVWDSADHTLQRLVDSGRVDAQQAADLRQRYPHYVPTVPISHLDGAGGGPVAAATGPRVSAGTERSIHALDDVATSGESLNPIVAVRNQIVRAERDIQRNTVAQAFAQMLDDAMQASPSQMGVNQGTHRTFLGGGTDVQYWANGERHTISVPKPIADGLEAASNMGASPGTVGRIWKKVMGVVTSAMTAGRASFLPVNVVRDAQDYALRTAAHEGGPLALPGVMGTWLQEAGNAVVDVMRAQATARGAAGAAIGAASGAAVGDENTTIGERARHAVEGGIAGTFLLGANKVNTTGKALEYLSRGGGSGAASAHWGAGQRWYRDVLRNGGAVVKSPQDAARYLGDWLSDIGSLQGIKGINERAELISRTAAMRRGDQQGLAPVEAMTRGRDASYDPDRAGTVARMVNGVVPFFNASVQNAAQTARLFKQNPIAGAATITATLGPAMLAAESWNRSDPDRAQTYDDVPQYLKDTGLVVVTGGHGSDARGDRPRYLWIPTGIQTPFVIGMRKAMENLPGLEPTAGRGEEGWADVLGTVIQTFNPLRGDSFGAAASNLIPQGVKQVVELGANRDLYRGTDIATAPADERASAASRGISGGLNAAGRLVGNDWLQNVHPSQVEKAIGSLPAYGDIVTGASDMVAPSGYKQAEDRPVANEPFLGGIGGRFVRDTGGANLQRAQDARLPESLRSALAAADMRPEDIKPVPSSFKGAPLTRAEQERWQRATTAALPRELATARQSDEWRTPATREKAIQAAMSRAQSVAAERVLRNLSETEIQRRQRVDQSRKAS